MKVPLVCLHGIETTHQRTIESIQTSTQICHHQTAIKANQAQGERIGLHPFDIMRKLDCLTNAALGFCFAQVNILQGLFGHFEWKVNWKHRKLNDVMAITREVSRWLNCSSLHLFISSSRECFILRGLSLSNDRVAIIGLIPDERSRCT